MTRRREATVVGAGPNGLAAAVALAQRGLRVTVLEADETVGGGTRTRELTVPGLRHDVCSGIHPFALTSPFFATLPLQRHGLTWRWPEVELGHPLDDVPAGLLLRSLDATAERMGVDGPAWKRVFGPVARHLDTIARDALGPLLRVPSRPLRLAQLGIRAGLPAAVLARALRTEPARALFLGCAAHAFRPLGRPATSAIGTLHVAAGHRYGWPVAEGGSQAITLALASLLEELGGSIVTEATVKSLADLPPADVTLFDTSPGGFAEIAGAALPGRPGRALRRWRYGPAAYKVDVAVRGDIPWRDPGLARAGTVHLGGSGGEIIDAEASVAAGRMPDRPFVLLGQQYVADPTRSAGGLNPVYTYAHVPHAYDGDATGAVLDQVERFAPGFRDRVTAVHVTTPADFEAYNPNYVGGDILTGANTVRQLVARPAPGLAGYDTGIPGMFLCSAATPPGAGVHGMCGYHAAQRALRHLRNQ